jgi:hypothetical protein
VAAANSPGPPVHLERCTIRGRVRARQIDMATETIFDGLATAERIQVGCVRFSYVRPGSRTPRRYRCQPDLALAARAKALGLGSADELPADERARVETRLVPTFRSLRLGDPSYAQLDLRTAVEIREGGEDRSEMGAFHDVYGPQRERNLRVRLDEYLRFGLEAGIFYET